MKSAMKAANKTQSVKTADEIKYVIELATEMKSVVEAGSK